MNYKGQILSDNLTQSQIDLFKYLIDQGLTTDEIIKMYRTPDSADDIGGNILKKNYGGMANIEQMTAPLSRRGETQVASEMGPYDMSGWYDMYTDMQSRGELPGWMDSFDEGPNSFMQNLDVLDISPWDFVQRKGKKEVQVADRPYGPSWEHFEELMGDKLKLMTDEEIDKEVNEFLEMFSHIDLPNPEQYPRCFAWYVKLYKYYKEQEKR